MTSGAHALRRRLASGESTVLAARLATFGVGPLTVLAIGGFFTPTLQGYYYAFTSIVAASQLFEAGISTAVIQIAAHESARVRLTRDGLESESPSAVARLAAVFRFALGWYGGVAALMALCIASLGFVVFSKQHADVNWLTPWIVLVAMAAVDLGLQAFFVVLEGTGQIVRVYRYRLARVLALNGTLIVSVAFGAGLLALGLGLAAAALVGILEVLRWRRFFSAILQIDARGAISWRREILPFQWRVAISWMAGYLSASSFTPILLTTAGPVEAGQMGMSMMLVNACTSLAASFIQAKGPSLGALAGEARWLDLIRLFSNKARHSIGAAAALLVSACLAVVIAQAAHFPLAERLLPWWAFALVAAGVLGYHTEGVFAFFLRAQKREPYFVLEVIGAAVIVPGALVVSPKWGSFGLCALFATVHLALLLPFATSILIRDLRHKRGLSAPTRRTPLLQASPDLGRSSTPAVF